MGLTREELSKQLQLSQTRNQELEAQLKHIQASQAELNGDHISVASSETPIDFQAIVETSPDFIIVVNQEHQIQYVNHLLPGLTSEMVIDTPVYNFIPDGFQEIARSAINRVFDGHPITTYETISPSPQGEDVWYDTRVTPILENGTVELVTLTATKITDRKEVEDALRRNEQQYRQILDSIKDFVLVKGEKSSIVWANQAFRDYYGMTEEELQGLIDAPFAEPDYTEQYVIDDEKVFTTGEVLEIPNEPIKRHDGFVKPFETVKSPIFDEDDNVIMTVGVSRDISERLEAEATIRRQSALVERSREFIGIATLDGIIEYVNPAGLELTEYESLDDVVGKPFGIFHPSDAMALISDVGIPTAMGKGSWRAETTLRTQSGIIRQIDISVYRIDNKSGQPDSLVAVIDDITQVRAAEEDLKRSEEDYRFLANNTADVIARSNADGVYTYVSESASTLYGYTPEELIGQVSYDFIHPQDVADMLSTDDNSSQVTSDFVTTELRFQHKEGHYVWVEATSRLFFEDGEFKEAISASRDISDRKAIEQTLRASRERLQEAQEIANLGLWEWNLQTNDLYWSDETYKLLGQEKSIDPNYDLFLQSVHSDDRDEINALVQNSVQTGESFEAEIRFVRPDNSMRYSLARGRLEYDERGNSKALLGTSLDITIRKQAELAREKLIKDLEAARRIAEENSRLKSEFLATMSHELRTPMNAIKGFTSIMLKQMAGVTYNDKAERYLNKIQSNSDRLLGLINDFLDLSRIESGRMELAYLPIVPADMAQKWHDNLSVLAENKNLAFDIYVDPDLPTLIYGDEEAISKVATNLVGNAVKFTEQGQVSVKLTKQNTMMQLQVSDTGIGIPPHARDFIFDEFRQIDQSSKRKHGGTGLGLSIVQKLVLTMQGTVTIESEVGVGSTFTIQLPIVTT